MIDTAFILTPNFVTISSMNNDRSAHGHGRMRRRGGRGERRERARERARARASAVEATRTSPLSNFPFLFLSASSKTTLHIILKSPSFFAFAFFLFETDALLTTAAPLVALAEDAPAPIVVSGLEKLKDKLSFGQRLRTSTPSSACGLLWIWCFPVHLAGVHVCVRWSGKAMGHVHSKHSFSPLLCLFFPLYFSRLLETLWSNQLLMVAVCSSGR